MLSVPCYDLFEQDRRLDTQAPPLPLVSDFCLKVGDWLQKDPQNVAVVHCKAGKGRTGTMICSYLVHAVRTACVCQVGKLDPMALLSMQGEHCQSHARQLETDRSHASIQSTIVVSSAAVLQGSGTQGMAAICLGRFQNLHLLSQGICKTAQEALDLYGAKRTLDGNGVTNPSQRRFAACLKLCN